MSRLDDVLARTIEGFLHYDLSTMAMDDHHGRGVAYPILTSTCAGIEFLGALLSTDPFEPVGKSTSYFSAYWREHLYPAPSPRAEFGGAVYKLVRNGLAHSFAMKKQIGVHRKNAALHLVRSPTGVFIIDAVQLARDFLLSYSSRIKPQLGRNSTIRARMEIRLAEIDDQYERDAAKQAPVLLAAPLVADLKIVSEPPSVPAVSLMS